LCFAGAKIGIFSGWTSAPCTFLVLKYDQFRQTAFEGHDRYVYTRLYALAVEVGFDRFFGQFRMVVVVAEVT